MLMNWSMQKAIASLYNSTFSFLEGVDWFNEARLVVTASLLAGVILIPILFFPASYLERLKNILHGTFSQSHVVNCFGMPCPYDSTVRTLFTDSTVHIYAWPSRGGVIVLDSAEAIDFEFLGLRPLDPPLKRLDDQAAEDAFCQRLLLLGAKWWDSEARYVAVGRLELGGRRADDGEPPPTMREKRFVKVAWPSTGGVWVAEFDTTYAGVDEEDNLLPDDEGAARIQMARTMDERSAILRDRFKASFYENLEGYRGYTFLNCWETKEGGEVGPLLQLEETISLWKKSFSKSDTNIRVNPPTP